MCWSSRHSLTRPAGFGRWSPRAVAVFLGMSLLAAAASPAHAQVRPVTAPVPTAAEINSDLAAGGTALNLGSSFLERLGNQAGNFYDRSLRTNPGGGGASEDTEGPRYRSWVEAYGISARTGAQGDFVGDKRTTWGGIARLGARIAPGMNVGFSIDHSRTAIDVPLALQSATLDLTQFGFNASVDRGPWTWALALVHGFGNVHTRRDTGFGFAMASYGATVDGALTELSYYWTRDQSRIVPKAAIEYVRATTGSWQEVGGLAPLTGSTLALERSRVMIGAEIGHYFIFDRKILDLLAYGKFVDNFSQNLGSITVSLGPQSIAVQGIGESRYGADAGASASLSLTRTARLYLNYDARFRAALQSHQGMVGFELRW